MESKLFFAKHVEEYQNSTYWNNDEEYIYKTYLKGKILIIGCGAGRVLAHIKGDVVAIDNVEGMVDASKKNFPQNNIQLMDATNMNFEDNSFDSVFFPFHGMSFVHDKKALYSEIARVLKPGGVAILNCGNRWFIKALKQIFIDPIEANGLTVYRNSWLEKFKLERYFKSVKVVYRISLQPIKNWKDRFYKTVPIISKSIYFICTK